MVDTPNNVPDSDGSPGSTNAIIEDLWGRIQSQQRVKLKTLFDPFSSEVYPAADVAVDKYSIDHIVDGGFDNNAQAIPWNSPNQNVQSMLLVPNDPANAAAGCQNLPTPRALGANLDFEWEITGDRFAVMMVLTGASNYDCQIYVSDEAGKMRRLKARPLTTNIERFGFRVVRFNSFRTRRVRFVGKAPSTYYQLIVPLNTTVRKPADKPLAISISDSFREGSGMYVAGTAESYSTGAINDRWQERTGFALIRMGQGGTGLLNNGTGNASDGPSIPGNPCPFFYDGTIDKIKSIGKNKIRLIDVNGTINDGILFASKQAVKDKLNQGLNKISSWDPGIRFVLTTPEPYNFGVPGDPANLNIVHVAQTRAAYLEVAAARSDIIGVVDANNPSSPFFWGNGSEAQVAGGNGTPQAIRTSTDGIHYNYAGGQAYADQIVDAQGEFYIERERPIVA